jgi:hypothetical protein
MLQTVEAEIDVNGNVRLLTPVKVTRPTRALVTLLDEASPANIIPPEITDPAERARVIEEIVRRMQANPIPPDAPYFTREELHERR